MTRKREIERPYPPDYISAETLAYRLDLSRSTVDDWVTRGLLPPAKIVGTAQRWRWSDIESAIASPNGELALPNGTDFSVEDDPFSTGTKNVTPSHA